MKTREECGHLSILVGSILHPHLMRLLTYVPTFILGRRRDSDRMKEKSFTKKYLVRSK